MAVPNLEWLKARPYEMRYSILKNQGNLSYPPMLILKKNIT
jgi:hypothetical protein